MSEPLKKIRQEITELAKRSGRRPEDIKILAVSKLQPTDKIRTLHEQGQKAFGENYVQELKEKMTVLSDLKDLHWHLIGHLQKNKVKMVVGFCELIHSVDSLELAKEISKRAQAQSVNQRILLQVNVAGEASKEGLSLDLLQSTLPEIVSLPGLTVAGLMTMPPFVENAEQNRSYFRQLKNLFNELRPNLPATFTELSMGTSQDYNVAIEEGATWVRLGTMLFGERIHQK